MPAEAQRSLVGPGLALATAVAGLVPFGWVWWHGIALGDPLIALLSGVAILAAAFLLSWAVEVAEQDVPPAVAISVLALVAVLPEYAVDATFAWKAGTDPTQAGYAVANMTGGNRLLLGVGWAAMVLLAWMRLQLPAIRLSSTARIDIAVLLLASAWALVPTLLGRLALVDTAVLVGLYLLYVWCAARATSGEGHGETSLVGAAQLVGRLSTLPRWVVISAMVGVAAVGIVMAAEPFAEALVHTGKHAGIDEFLLVQWVAPLASEAPEFIVAALLVLRGHPEKGLLTLVSSKVNQWTLLVGTLPAVTSIAAGEVSVLPLDARQREEVLLTAAQSLFGVVLLANLKLERGAAIALFALFALQFAVQGTQGRVVFGIVYLVLAAVVLAVSPRTRSGLFAALRYAGRVLIGRG